jgi:hypothetical protein
VDECEGVVVAKSVADLHSDANKLGGENSLTEKGAQVQGSQHDILTGSQADGTLQTGDAPCGNWTSAETTGGAMVGHHNKQGGGGRANLLELRALVARLLAAESHRHGRQRLLLLLRELKRAAPPVSGGAASANGGCTNDPKE